MPQRDRPSTIRFRLAATALLLTTASLACGEEAPPPVAAEASTRVLGEGRIIGSLTADGAHVWRGIPFAEPPVGPLRWRAPKPAASWTGEREALDFASACVQIAGQAGGDGEAKEGEVTGSEDCLYLNVFAPAFEPEQMPRGDAALPVMVWIHGGGNSVGDARMYDAGLLAQQEKLIVVTVQYRLGLLGWFAEPAIHGENASAEDRSGNYGTLDLVESLRWVRRNIASFGGDPDRVTVFGESAGATNVFSLLLAKPAKGLFHRAIAQSGGAWTSSIVEASHRVDADPPGDAGSSGELAIRYMMHDEGAGDRAAAVAKLDAMGAEAYGRSLRQKSPEQLLAVVDAGFGGMYHLPRLYRDGAVLPVAPPIEVFSDASRYNSVPTILGTNRDENKLFMLFTSDSVVKLFGIPLWLDDADHFDAETQYPSQMWKVRGVDEPAAVMRRAQGASVYGYRFDWDEQPKLLSADFSRMLGAAHAMEIPFVFGHLNLGAGTPFVFDDDKREINLRLSRQMMSYWAEFAYAGNPGRGRRGDQPMWHAWSPDENAGEKFIVLDVESDGGIRMSGDVVSRQSIIANVLRDDRFEGWDDRCEVLRNFVIFSRMMEPSEYLAVGDGACKAWPLESSES